MRLWHMLLVVAVAALGFGFIRIAGRAAIVSAVGMGLVILSFAILGYSEDVFRILRHLTSQARARRAPSGYASVLALRVLCFGYAALILASAFVLFGVVAILILIGITLVY
jgi:hypothetical protein